MLAVLQFAGAVHLRSHLHLHLRSHRHTAEAVDVEQPHHRAHCEQPDVIRLLKRRSRRKRHLGQDLNSPLLYETLTSVIGYNTRLDRTWTLAEERCSHTHQCGAFLNRNLDIGCHPHR